jgi:hypothetical protein
MVQRCNDHGNRGAEAATTTTGRPVSITLRRRQMSAEMGMLTLTPYPQGPSCLRCAAWRLCSRGPAPAGAVDGRVWLELGWGLRFGFPRWRTLSERSVHAATAKGTLQRTTLFIFRSWPALGFSTLCACW